MPKMLDKGRTTSTGAARGLIAGAVLRSIRESISHSQEVFAERLHVSPETVQSWETGRRPLANVSFVELQRLRRGMAAAGAQPALLRSCYEITLS